MGQKVHPVGMRLGINRTWKSRWFARKNYAELLKEDLTIRRYVGTKLSRAGISDVVIERKADKVVVNVSTARPGIVIGRKGIEVERLNKELEHLTGKDIKINILEVKRIELDAQLVAEHIARQLEQRMGYRRAMRKAAESAMRLGAQGIKVRCAGRLGGAEMARVMEHREGRVPLHTLRADIDFARAIARTTYGTVGVKVWMFKGEKLGDQMGEDSSVESEERGRGEKKPYRGARKDRGKGGTRPRREARDREESRTRRSKPPARTKSGSTSTTKAGTGDKKTTDRKTAEKKTSGRKTVSKKAADEKAGGKKAAEKKPAAKTADSSKAEDKK